MTSLPDPGTGTGKIFTIGVGWPAVPADWKSANRPPATPVGRLGAALGGDRGGPGPAGLGRSIGQPRWRWAPRPGNKWRSDRSSTRSNSTTSTPWCRTPRPPEPGWRPAAPTRGLFNRPTVLADVQPFMRAYAEEVFGPVAPVLAFVDVEAAIALAANTEYGLSFGILGDVGLAMRIADAVPSGNVHINEQSVSDEANAPFGGIAAAGTGARFGGPQANIEALTETQWLTLRPTIAWSPF